MFHVLLFSLLVGQIQPTVQMVSLPDCNGAMYAVDVYRPIGTPPFPLVGLAHGFQNSKTNFRGLAQELAANGVLVVVPQFPNLIQCSPSDHPRNGRILGKAIETQITAGLALANNVALAGHSAGGLAAFSLASTLNVKALVLLDAVDSNGTGLARAPMISAPVLFLVANGSMCNTQNNSLAWYPLVTAPKARLNVTGATHCDPQEPSNIACTGGCGGFNMVRSAVFKKYAALFLRHSLFQNAACFETMTQNDVSSGVLSMPNFQLGSCVSDAGVVDAGAFDAGTAPDASVDAGMGPPDSSIADAGTTPTDAGALTNDSGAFDSGMDLDAGNPVTSPGPSDGGSFSNNPMPPGCGCHFSPIGTLFLLVAFKRFRRRETVQV